MHNNKTLLLHNNSLEFIEEIERELDEFVLNEVKSRQDLPKDVAKYLYLATSLMREWREDLINNE